MVEPGKTAVRRAVGRELKRMRNNKGLNLTEATASARRMGSKALMQVERGRNLPHLGDVEPLLTAFGQSDRIAAFANLVREGTERKNWREWWEDRFPADFVPEDVRLLLSCEASATELTLYRAQFMPELFQIAEYTEAIVRVEVPEFSDDEVRAWVRLTLGRGEVLDRADPPRIRAVLDEAALRRTVRGPALMREQLAHLAKLARRPHVDLRIVPENAGAHPATTGSFTRIHCLPELPDYPGIVHVETAAGEVYYEEPEHIDRFDDVWVRLHAQALSAERSKMLIEQYAKALRTT